MKLKNALGFISPKYKEPSVCESCGEKFTCGATVLGCWCTEIKLTDEARQDLKEKFRACLCRNCLEKQVSKAAMKITYPNGTVELIEDAVRIDTQNFHEGMFDFYDARGNLLKQIDMGAGITWETLEQDQENKE